MAGPLPEPIQEAPGVETFELETHASPEDLAVANHLLATLLIRFHQAQQEQACQKDLLSPPSHAFM